MTIYICVSLVSRVARMTYLMDKAMHFLMDKAMHYTSTCRSEAVQQLQHVLDREAQYKSTVKRRG